MANEDKKEELLINQELVNSARTYTSIQESLLGIDERKKTAQKEILDVSRKLALSATEELAFAKESTSSLRTKSDLLAAQAKQQQISQKVNQGYMDHSKSMSKKMNEEELKAFNIKKSALIQQFNLSKKVEKSIEDQIDKREELNTKLGWMDDALRGISKIPFVGQFVQSDEILKSMEKTTLKTGSAFKGMIAGLKKGFSMLAKNPLMLALAASAAILKFMVGMAFQLSKNMTQVQKVTGLSKDVSEGMYSAMRETSKETGKVYITSTKILQTFTELTEKTGLIANFGDDFLETMTTLKDRLGMSVDESEQLSYLTRLQGKDGDKILESQVKIVNQFNKQNKSLISARGVFKQIANTSLTVASALGNSLDNITKAAAAATRLGLSMDEIHGAAGGFLDFQTSIQKELEFSLLTNQQVSFAKERQLALDNDIAGLADALINKESVLLAFRTGNRIQMESAAGAMNMTTDQLAKIIKQKDYERLIQSDINGGMEEYIALYGEQSYQSMLELDAQEKIAAAKAQFNDRLMEAGELMLPLIEKFATLMEQLSRSDGLINTIIGSMKLLLVVTGALAARSITVAIAKAWSAAMSPINPANISTLGAAGLIAGGIATAAIMSSTSMAPPLPPVDVKDAAISGIKINTLPMDSIEIDKGANKIAVGTNLNGDNNMDAVVKAIADLKKAIVATANINVTTTYDSFEASNKQASNGIGQTNTKYKSSFD